ncbi:MAG: type III-A CRISPR-associated RAMP protein Csm3 [Planctomycetes bacterium]|nr:type III-A CRISPR-associated RAMP protein Csm3 [Planctomycetota bacterium]
MQLRLIGHYRLAGVIRLVTGLHIGKGKDDIEIGGKDNPVILTPDGVPYIPGSSLKGKIRSLLEWDTGVHPEGKVRGFQGPYHADDPVLRVFGVPASDGTDPLRPPLGPTRALFADAFLADRSLGATRDWGADYARGQWQTEEKNENSLNRITAMANPRPMERVPAGVEFALDVRYRVFDVAGDAGRTDRENFRWVLKGLALLEDDALGGGGSRGSGVVRFAELRRIDEGGAAQALELAEVRRNPPTWVAPAAGGGR